MIFEIDDEKLADRRREMRETTREQYLAIFTLAGLRATNAWELANNYWPDSPRYDDVRAPWWLFKTEIGLIRIGRRKRVIEIRWDDCAVRGVVTADDVTKGDTIVHAWSTEKAVEYLKALKALAAKETP